MRRTHARKSYTQASSVLVYVALSRVTNIEGLFIVTPDNDPTNFRFHHNRVQASSTKSLLQEFQRLSLNPLHTKAQTI